MGDVDALTTALTEHTSQLSSVRELLSALPTDAPEHADMLLLAEQLMQTIAATSDALAAAQQLQLRKAALIEQLQGGQNGLGLPAAHGGAAAAAVATAASPSPVLASASATATATATTTVSTAVAATAAVVAGARTWRTGERCQVLYVTSTGDGLWLDAIVHARVPVAPAVAGDENDDGVPCYVVLFTTPTHTAMKTCRSVFADTTATAAGPTTAAASALTTEPLDHATAPVCALYGAACRFGHGYRARADRLRSLAAQRDAERHLAPWRVGDECLARYRPDGLWYSGVVRHLRTGPGAGDTTVSVHYSGYDACDDALSLLDDVRRLPVPVHVHDAHAHRATTRDAYGVDDDPHSTGRPVPAASPPPAAAATAAAVAAGGAIGSWESHTRGIGLRVLSRFGYQVGTGLGKRRDGRAEPVLPGAVLPAGLGLDGALAAAAAGTSGRESKTERELAEAARQRRERRERAAAAAAAAAGPSVFDFLNRTFASFRSPDAAGAKRKPAAAVAAAVDLSSPPPAAASGRDTTSRALVFVSSHSKMVVPPASPSPAPKAGATPASSPPPASSPAAAVDPLRKASAAEDDDAADSAARPAKRARVGSSDIDLRRRLLELQAQKRTAAADVQKWQAAAERQKRDASAPVFRQKLADAQAQLRSVTAQEVAISSALGQRKSKADAGKF